MGILKDLLPELLKLGESFLPTPLRALAPFVEKGLKLLSGAGIKLPTPEAAEAAVTAILLPPPALTNEEAVEAGRAARDALHVALRKRNRWAGRTHDSYQREQERDGR